MKIYKRSHFPTKPIRGLRGLQWFALTSDYGKDSYGPYLGKYILRKSPRLLDLGNENVRAMIRNAVGALPGFKKLDDPDEQYSGGVGNRRYHEVLMTYFGGRGQYNGTIIDQRHMTGSPQFKADYDGPSEIVLWKNFRTLLKVAAAP